MLISVPACPHSHKLAHMLTLELIKYIVLIKCSHLYEISSTVSRGHSSKSEFHLKKTIIYLV